MRKSSGCHRPRLIVGNWKMNGSADTYDQLVHQILSQRQGNEAQMVVCPPFTHLDAVSRQLHSSTLMLGAQNVSAEDQGAYTGEISAKMLLDFGCKFVIIGHNERRRMQGETDLQVAKKAVTSCHNGLLPIICLGESLSDREKGSYLDIIERQLTAVLDVLNTDEISQSIFAYEPVWAVGTGKVAGPDQISEVHHFLRSSLGVSGKNTKILYGGSVKANNAETLFALPDVDGALLGGASLDPQEFLAIARIANSNQNCSD